MRIFGYRFDRSIIQIFLHQCALSYPLKYMYERRRNIVACVSSCWSNNDDKSTGDDDDAIYLQKRRINRLCHKNSLEYKSYYHVTSILTSLALFCTDETMVALIFWILLWSYAMWRYRSRRLDQIRWCYDKDFGKESIRQQTFCKNDIFCRCLQPLADHSTVFVSVLASEFLVARPAWKISSPGGRGSPGQTTSGQL